MVQEKQVNVRLTDKDYEELNKLVNEGYFGSVSDAVRTAVRYLLRDFRSKVEHAHGRDKKETVAREV